MTEDELRAAAEHVIANADEDTSACIVARAYLVLAKERDELLVMLECDLCKCTGTYKASRIVGGVLQPLAGGFKCIDHRCCLTRKKWPGIVDRIAAARTRLKQPEGV